MQELTALDPAMAQMISVVDVCVSFTQKFNGGYLVGAPFFFFFFFVKCLRVELGHKVQLPTAA